MVEEVSGYLLLLFRLNFRAVWQDPIEIPITEEYTLYSVPLPGSGSVLAFMLNMLRDWVGDGTATPTGSNLYWHRVVETFKYAYAKRTGLGDPSRSNLPIHEVSHVHSVLLYDQYILRRDGI